MVLAGANEDTFEQIKSTLGFNTDMTESQLYTSFRILLRQLNNFSSNANNTLELANAIALQSEYSLLPTYLHIVKNRLKAEIFSVNFQVKGKQAAEKINQWVNRKTRGKIDTILKGNPTADTRMVLLNALSSYSLKPALQSMGIEAAFDPDSADFGRMTNQKDLMVAEVLHKAVVEVNEQGTEAAAVSAMR
ncbi:PREDICTED: leukocyte elastase inhibitor-like, partial [Rhagoletis zephyria]|uniref:leukocyte elastase inhibitor-like n=1 Tax=Rhagoletis zephyria TaxID=28612 RepID=UPI0008113A08